jgi:succinate dehydrogenase / fumarate reductase iron-sulfur subunit
MQVRFQIIRQTGDRPPTVQHYPLEVEPTTTILDCLNQIKWQQDGTLAFRKNCRNTICGSCGMRVNGRSALACKENVGEVLEKFPAVPSRDGVPTVTIAPLGNLPVIKDLIVDMKPFWNHLEAVDPYVSSQARQVPERETLQAPEDRAKLDAAGNCILCGACYSACNAREVNPNFVGPHALAKAQRMVDDTRDQTTAERLEQYSSTDGVWGCTRCYNCNDVCPMEVAPLDRISQIKSEILARSTAETSRPIRHRKVLVDMVKSGGWVDERQFAMRVVGNGFRDWRGLLNLGPVGLRMLVKGKFPFTFEPSEGTGEVRGLIESVQRDRPDPNP